MTAAYTDALSHPATQGIKFVLLLSRQGKVRLSKWYTTYNQKERAKLVRDITPLVLGRSLKLCNFLDYPGMGEIKVLVWLSCYLLVCHSVTTS
jgi:AP-1 complex subunit sigma 1/2